MSRADNIGKMSSVTSFFKSVRRVSEQGVDLLTASAVPGHFDPVRVFAGNEPGGKTWHITRGLNPLAGR